MARETLKWKIDSLLEQALQLANNKDPNRPSPFTTLTEGVVGNLAAGAVKGYGLDHLIPANIARSTVKKGFRAKRKAGEEKWMDQQKLEVNHLIDKLSGILRQVSFDSPTLTNKGNNHLLLNKVTKVRRLKTVKGKVANLISLLEELQNTNLIPNDDLPAFMAMKAARNEHEASEIMTNLENALRQTIRTILSENADWWTRSIPTEIRKRAESKKLKEEGINPSISTPADNLAFVGFSDYDDIIILNWDVFAPLFKDRDWLVIKLKELEQIRNNIMHSRGLTEHGLAKLRIVSIDLLGKLNNDNL